MGVPPRSPTPGRGEQPGLVRREEEVTRHSHGPETLQATGTVKSEATVSMTVVPSACVVSGLKWPGWEGVVPLCPEAFFVAASEIPQKRAEVR